MVARSEDFGPRVAVALDTADPAGAIDLARWLDPELCRVKVGKELFTAGGPAVVQALQAQGLDVFLDLKFHDIPNTVGAACRVAAGLGVWMINVHATGGAAMLDAARGGVRRAERRPLLTAVTVLTSLDQGDLETVGFAEVEPRALGMRLTRLALAHGCDGVVCSAHEARQYRAEFGEGPVLVTPGIRLEPAPEDDQKRAMTPREAIADGADLLVVGRPVTAAADPIAALERIQDGIADGLVAR